MENYKLETTSVWSFKDRGKWATHSNNYRGNWSPHIPKNIILRYSRENETVADLFAGSGTTLIECKLLNRNSIGVDINQNAINICKNRLKFDVNNNSTHNLICDSSTKLDIIKNTSIDLICMHTPYANIIKYSNNIINDLSLLPYTDFLDKLNLVAKESYRILKTNKVCSFMIGDIRKNNMVIPLGFMSLQAFLNNGFVLKEIIIKQQHNCKMTPFWEEKSIKYNFYLLAHEYIFILIKK